MYDAYPIESMYLFPTATLCARDNRLVPWCPFRHYLGTKRQEHVG